MNFKLILGLLMISAVLTAAQAACAGQTDCASCLVDAEGCVWTDDNGDTSCIASEGMFCSNWCGGSGYECYDSLSTCSIDFCASCLDQIKNFAETDVDCGGGNCEPCAEGDTCLVNYDCSGLNCDGGVCGTALPTCTDGILNQGETAFYNGAECGGLYCKSCPPTEVGDYTGINFDISGQIVNPKGITTDGTNIWVVDDTTNSVYKYDMDGTYTGSSFSVAGQDASPSAVTTDGTNIWVVGKDNDRVYKYTMAGAYVDFFLVGQGENNPSGITTDGTNIWVAATNAKKIYKYQMDGTYVSQFTANGAGSDAPNGVTTDGVNIWVSYQSAHKVYKYTMSGTNLWETFDTGAETDYPIGIAQDGTYFWISAYSPSHVYAYSMITHGYNMVSQGSVYFELSDNTDVTSNRQTGTKTVYVRDTASGNKVGFLSVDFDQATGSIAVEDLTVATDWAGKALMHHDAFTDPAITNGYLLVPWLGEGYVGYHCPNAAIMDDITPSCSGKTTGYTTIVNIMGINYIQMPNQGGGEELGGGSTGAPEFSDFAWILAAVLGAGGFFLIRRKKSF